jgi:hypothetical protein
MDTKGDERHKPDPWELEKLLRVWPVPRNP